MNRTLVNKIEKKWGVKLGWKSDEEMLTFLKKNVPSLVKLMEMTKIHKHKRLDGFQICSCGEYMGMERKFISVKKLINQKQVIEDRKVHI